MGGKGKLLWLIDRLAPARYARFVDVFGGSGTVTLNRPLRQGCAEIYNDYNSSLANLFCCVKDRPMALLRELGFLPLNARDDFNVLYRFFSRQEFTGDYLKEELELTQVFLEPPQEEMIRRLMLERTPRGDVRRAADYFKLIRYSFSGVAHVSDGGLRHDITDVPPAVRRMLEDIGTCAGCLDDLIMLDGEVVCHGTEVMAMLQFYVVDDLRKGTLDIHHVPSLPDAVRAYKALPASGQKVLGVQQGADAIDLIHCLPLSPNDREGEDVMELRFLEYPLWKSDPQVMELARELAARLRIRYCLFQRCLLPVPDKEKLPRALRGKHLWPDEPGEFCTAAQWIYVAGVGRLSPVEFRRRYLDSPGASHPLVVHIGAHGMDDRGCYKSLQVSPWEFHLLVRHAKERAGRRNARAEHNSSND